MSRVQDATTTALGGAPVVTYHAADQWDARTGAGSVAPETLWRDAWEMSVVSHPEYRWNDEMRYHEPTETVLVRRNEVIPTVLAASGHESDRVIRDAVANQFGIVLSDSS